MPKATALKEYVTAANKLLSAYGKSFHWARYFLGKEAGLQATQLYAFCRYLDDIADQPGNLGATELKSIQNIFNNFIILPPQILRAMAKDLTAQFYLPFLFRL